MGYHRVKRLVLKSLVRADDGLLRIVPNAELSALAKDFPTLRYAAFDALSGLPAEGSALELINFFERIKPISPRWMDFYVNSQSSGRLVGTSDYAATPFGTMSIAAYGYSFQWTDWLYFFASQSWIESIIFVMIFVFSAVVCWLVIHRAMMPVFAAASQAARIDLATVGQRLPTSDLSPEILPLVDAINGALARLDSGVARMRRYTANAAHELRTPLAIMRARLENPPETTSKLDLIRDVSQLQAIVEQLLISSRLSERQAQFDELIDLKQTVWKVVADYAPLVLDSDKNIEFERDNGQIEIRGNQRAVQSAVANLIDNALRAEPAGGTVIVRVRKDALIEVIDHGAGVDTLDRELIFEPFWWKSEATGGTGLGLAITKELMDQHGGGIWVEETPGGGATFKLKFPSTDPN